MVGLTAPYHAVQNELGLLGDLEEAVVCSAPQGSPTSLWT